MPGMLYGTAPPPTSGLRKAGVSIGAILAGIGAFLIWAGYLWAFVFPPNSPGAGRLIVGILYTGAITGFGGSLLGAFASPKDEPMQKLGLFLLAAVFIFSLTSIFRPTYFLP